MNITIKNRYQAYVFGLKQNISCIQCGEQMLPRRMRPHMKTHTINARLVCVWCLKHVADHQMLDFYAHRRLCLETRYRDENPLHPRPRARKPLELKVDPEKLEVLAVVKDIRSSIQEQLAHERAENQRLKQKSSLLVQEKIDLQCEIIRLKGENVSSDLARKILERETLYSKEIATLKLQLTLASGIGTALLHDIKVNRERGQQTGHQTTN